ncbi:MAG: hypothetical protein LBH55_03810 [Mycoplasmataceae bacterium]|jgi:hypothetical protein|nr:hypothetical protein [Mycoplasmataceae bacterium]
MKDSKKWKPNFDNAISELLRDAANILSELYIEHTGRDLRKDIEEKLNRKKKKRVYLQQNVLNLSISGQHILFIIKWYDI